MEPLTVTVDALISSDDRDAKLSTLCQAVEACPSSAQSWWELLSHLEGRPTLPRELYKLYNRAVREVPRHGNQGNDAFTCIWVGFAKQQWLKSADDGRDTFKTLIRQGISGESSALLFLEWAALERDRGSGESKAASILQKGLREGAQPPHLLEAGAAELAMGTWKPVPLHLQPPASSIPALAGNQTASLSCSGSTSFPPMVTPALETERPMRTHPTLTLDTIVPPGLVPKLEAREVQSTAHSFSSASSRAPSEEATVCMPASTELAHHASRLGVPGSGSRLRASSVAASPEEDTIVIRRHRGPLAASRASTPLSTDVTTINKPNDATTRTGAGYQTKQGSVEPNTLLAAGTSHVEITAATSINNSKPPKPGDEQSVLRPLGKAMPRRAGMLGRALRVAPAAVQNENGAVEAVSQTDDSLRKRKADITGGTSLEAPPLRCSPENSADDEKLVGVASRSSEPSQVVAIEDSAVLATRHGTSKPHVTVMDGTQDNNAEEETAPVVLSALAQKIQRGRQSLAPAIAAQRRQIVLESDTAHSGSDGDATRPFSSASSGQENSQFRNSQGAGRDAFENRMQVVSADKTVIVPLLQQQAAIHASSQGAGPRSIGQVLVDQGKSHASSGPSQAKAAAPRQMAGGFRPSETTVPNAPSLLSERSLPSSEQGNRDVASSQQRNPDAASATRNARAGVPPQRRVMEDENTVAVKGITYTKLECVGRGGSSKVFKVMAPNRKIFALKRIRLTGRDTEAAAGFMDEITLLKSLRGKSNIIQLIDAEVYRAEGIIYMVLECGEIDLARLLQKREAARREQGAPVSSLDENFIRLYWEQMLTAVHTIHEKRIVHSDIKPANFLVVEGQLKLIDFGIAKAIQSDTTSIARESQVGTLNYMSPEAILGGQNNIKGGPPMKVGRASDIWSLGCILYQMVYGSTPFSHLPFIQKMHAIIDPGHQVSFPPIPNVALHEVLQRCLDRNPKTRISMKELLDHPFLRPVTTSDQGPVVPSIGGDKVELSRDQLERLLRKVAGAGVDSPQDLDSLSQQVFAQLCAGLSPQVSAQSGGKHCARTSSSRLGDDRRIIKKTMEEEEEDPDGRSTVVEQSIPSASFGPPPTDVASQAARAAAARSANRAQALEELERSRGASNKQPIPPASNLSLQRRAPLCEISEQALAKQAASLRHVPTLSKAGHESRRTAPPAGSLEAALRKGLQRFNFDGLDGT